MRAIHALGLTLLAYALAGPALAQDFVREPLRIPMQGAEPRGLEALLVRLSGTERQPLALITHGLHGRKEFRLNMTPLLYLPQALEFARRGWTAVIVMRRGYGDSDGDWTEVYGPCADRDYVYTGLTRAEDLRAAIAHLATRPDIDATRVIAMGQSGGGFAVTALTVDPPPGLIATINFAGGAGGRLDKEICSEDRVIRAFRTFGALSRIPMLWVYADNDRLFGPERARRFHQAFTEGGGSAAFVETSGFRGDGHALFSFPRGTPIWTPHVDAFLRKHRLVLRDEPLPLPMPTLTTPEQLGEPGRKQFAEFLFAPPHKAFAMSPTGRWAWVSARRTIAAAKHEALDRCDRNHLVHDGAHDRGAKEDLCRVVVIDEAPVADEVGAR